MGSGLLLLVIVVAAYLAAHVTSEWLARRFTIVSGAEYLLLGFLLGPYVANLIHADAFDWVAPFLTLGLGWIAALIGTEFYLPDLIRLPAQHFQVALLEALLTAAAVGGAMVAIFTYWYDLDVQTAILPAGTLAAVATASAPTGVALAVRAFRRRGPLLAQLQVTTAVDAAVAVVIFGLLLSIIHVPPPVLPRAPTATEWAVIAIGIGLVGGALFHLFLGAERHADRLFTSLAGAIVLVSGAAAYLRLSPLLPAMLVGVVLANTSRNRLEIRAVLEKVERPTYFLLLIFAGAAWRPSQHDWLLPVVLFLFVRVAAKVGGARIAGWLGDAPPALGKGWGRALLGHGGLAVAIAVNYKLHDASTFANVVFTAALASVLLTDLTSARLVHAVAAAAAPRDANPGRPKAERQRAAGSTATTAPGGPAA